MMATVWPVPSRQAQATLTAQGCASRGPPYARVSHAAAQRHVAADREPRRPDRRARVGRGAVSRAVVRTSTCLSRAETWWTGTPAWSK
jgi:hypothetical protein